MSQKGSNSSTFGLSHRMVPVTSMANLLFLQSSRSRSASASHWSIMSLTMFIAVAPLRSSALGLAFSSNSLVTKGTDQAAHANIRAVTPISLGLLTSGFLARQRSSLAVLLPVSHKK
eukprot:CAMPEP_0115485098 /NCGR_PEP_ID=MMETSP0271-20121206/59733_1 /TAXON_ID=71861 /ORGANISM="Scrippsiella trochoidea, Strain CCMP3099" /LENGTH=116 /DNA_ID=CAMNT_0002913043 /DNA_START=187 /DNA_END=537 /DNA_ORIENTATION=-